jgi:transcriptional regulator with XRE-family HTH domain
MTELAECLRNYRLENELTWRGLAKEVGMSEAGLWKIARGKVTAGELTEYKIRKKIDLDLPEVISDDCSVECLDAPTPKVVEPVDAAEPPVTNDTKP